MGKQLAVFYLPSILKSITLPDCTTGILITFLAQVDMKINEAVCDSYHRQTAVPACTRFVQGTLCTAVSSCFGAREFIQPFSYPLCSLGLLVNNYI